MINQSELYFRKVGKDDDKFKDKLMPNTIILKSLFSNNKIICIEEHNDNNGRKECYLRVIAEVNNQPQSFSCKINNEPYDLTEDSNNIVIVGNNIIELYNFNQNNNGQIINLSQIILDKNNINNNKDISKILCIEKTNKNFICGHSLGYISTWVTKQNSPFLENVKSSRIHLDSINKILFDTIENVEVIISCSSDKTLKVHSLDDFVCFKVLNFDEEVIDVKKVNNLNNQANYFINLKYGNLKLYDSSFSKVIVEIYNISKIDRKFICLRYSNNNTNNDNANNNINANNNNNDSNNNINNDNNIINNDIINNDNNNINSINIINVGNNNSSKINVLITEGNKLLIYDWVKKKSKNNNNNNNYNNNYNYNNSYYNNNYNNNYSNYNYNYNNNYNNDFYYGSYNYGKYQKYNRRNYK